MDELALILDGIENKVKRLKLHNEGLKEQIKSLELEKSKLLEDVYAYRERAAEMEKEMVQLQVATALKGKDPYMAKQQVNELLREIEKCYALLNSQAQ